MMRTTAVLSIMAAMAAPCASQSTEAFSYRMPPCAGALERDAADLLITQTVGIAPRWNETTRSLVFAGSSGQARFALKYSGDERQYLAPHVWADLDGDGRCDLMSRWYQQDDRGYDYTYVLLSSLAQPWRGPPPGGPGSPRPRAPLGIGLQTDTFYGQGGMAFAAVHAPQRSQVVLLAMNGWTTVPLRGAASLDINPGDVLAWNRKTRRFDLLLATPRPQRPADPFAAALYQWSRTQPAPDYIGGRGAVIKP